MSIKVVTHNLYMWCNISYIFKFWVIANDQRNYSYSNCWKCLMLSFCFDTGLKSFSTLVVGPVIVHNDLFEVKSDLNSCHLTWCSCCHGIHAVVTGLIPDCADLKFISFTNPFLHSHSYSFRTDFTDLNLYWIKGGGGALFVLVSGYVC